MQSEDHEIRRELGLRDVVLAQLLILIGTSSFGPAAKLGPSHVLLWTFGIFAFHIPQAAVVVHLNRIMPMEGGIYQWVKRAFNESLGFLVAWNTWLFFMVLLSATGLTVAAALSYAFSSFGGGQWLAVVANAIAVGAIAIVTTLGLAVGKRVHNAGSIAFLCVVGLMLVLPILLGRGLRFESPPVPELSLFNLTVFTKVTVFALAGYECLPILAGETRDPARSIALSVRWAVPVVAIVYIFGTNSILTFVPAGEIDLINPIAQAFRASVGGAVATAAILLVLAHDLAVASQVFAANTRLPMVAGWDRLLPEWFAHLHPRYRTPTHSIAFVAVATFAIGLLGSVGVGLQEGYQILQSAAGVLIGSTYLVLFAIPIVGPFGLPLWVRAAAASGFLVTLAFVVFSVFPIVEIPNPLLFGAKILAVVLGANALGVAVLVWGRGRA